MKAPEIPFNEHARLKSLQLLNILDTPPEERYDRITRVVAKMFDVPIVLISLVDENRQWFKSRFGLDATETPRDISFCGHTILQDDLFYVSDATKDERFFDNPLVTCAPDIRFYAANPIRTQSGEKIGTLCLIDSKPRNIDIKALSLLKKVTAIIELELANHNRPSVCAETELTNKQGFHQLADHALSVCRKVELPLSIAYFFIQGLSGLKDKDAQQYQMALSVITDVFASVITKSDLISRYEECGFTALFSNTSLSTAKAKAEHFCDILQAQLSELSSHLTVVYGVIEDDGVSELESLIFESFVNHYQNSKY